MNNQATNEKDPQLRTYYELRAAVGILGIALPFVLSIGLFIMKCCPIQDSISQYYYTRIGSYLTGTLCAVGLFMFFYKGYKEDNYKDGLLCNWAALFAVGVAFIPMQLNENEVCCRYCIVFFTDGCHWWRVLHFVSAGLLFLTFGYLSFFKFTKSCYEKHIYRKTRKYYRNIVYKTCGIIIFSCILVLGVYNANKNWGTGLKIETFTFWMESFMLVAFGTSWLVKGGGFRWLNDKEADMEIIKQRMMKEI